MEVVMKKIIQLALIGILLFTFNCNKDSNKNEINPGALLGLLSLIGNSTLTVKATYTGALTVDGAQPGTQRIYVYLYRSLGTTSRDPEPVYTGFSDPTTGSEETITINGIVDGKYYVVVFYDYRSGGNPDNQQDRYIIYNNTAYPGNAATVTISGNTQLGPITFDDTNKLLASSAFQSAPGSYTLTLKAQYNGTEGTGDKKIHVYLYNALGDTVTGTAPYKTAVTSTAAVPTTEYSFAFNGVLPGNYYILAFYDYSTTGTDTPGLEDDRYVLYNGKQYIDEADAVNISANTNIAGTIAFGDTYTLGAGGAFMSNYGTVTVGVNYSGAETTGHVRVYLYSSLGTGITDPAPLYSGASAGIVSNTGLAVPIEIPDVHFGNYYMAVLYDTDDDGIADVGEPYVLYASDQYVGDAEQFGVTTGATDLGTVNLADSYLLDAGGAYNVPVVTYTLNVPVRYTGTAATSGGTGDQIIHVSLYSALGANTTTPASPVYTGATGAVSVGEDATVSISGIAAGTYKMLVFYDYNSTGATSGIQGDRYVFYGDSGATSGASDLVISGNTTIPDGSRVIFGNSYRLQASGAYMTGGILTVHATYTGAESGFASKIYVYQYTTTGWPGTTSRTPAKVNLASTPGTVSRNTEYNIELPSITAGNYYILVFYDYSLGGGGNNDSAGDRYWLYPGSACTVGTATLLPVPFGYSDLTVSFSDSWALGTSAAWLTVCP
jgi:uncharacterized protein (DUF2141 family)